MVTELSTNLGDGGILSVEVMVSAHGVLTHFGGVCSVLFLLSDSVKSLLEVASAILPSSMLEKSGLLSIVLSDSLSTLLSEVEPM